MVTVNPGIYFRELMPYYARAAKICELVYDNINRLYEPYHSAGEDTSAFITLGGDSGIIQCRCLLGYYKPTIGGTADDVKRALRDFNKLLKEHKLEPNDFTGGELSDAEHFYASTVLTMVPILGLVANPIGNVSWDFIKPAISSIWKNRTKSLSASDIVLGTLVPGFGINAVILKSVDWKGFWKDMEYDVNQLTGPDLAGHRYGMHVTYINNYKYWQNKAWDYIDSD